MMKRIDLNGGGCRAVVSGGIAYFTGHVAQGPDLTSQMKALGRRYEELFAINGLKKDHIVYGYACLYDIALKDEFIGAFQQWMGSVSVPLLIYEGKCAQPDTGDRRLLELALWVVDAEDADIQRYTWEDGCASMWDGTVYFSGFPCCPDVGETGKEGLAKGLSRYAQLFDELGLRNDCVLSANLVADAADGDDDRGVLCAAFQGHTPAVAVMPAKTGLGPHGAELSLIVATDTGRVIRRIRDKDAIAAVIYNGTAYFSSQYGDTAEQAFGEYDRVFFLVGIRKENVVTMLAHVGDLAQYGPFFGTFAGWCVPGFPASGVAVATEAAVPETACVVQLIAEETPSWIPRQSVVTADKEDELQLKRTPLKPSLDVEKVNKALQKSPKEADLYITKGLLLRRQMMFREAVEAYSQGLVWHPEYSMLYRHRGHAYLNLGRPEEAAADFVRGIASDPYNWDCWYHLGLAYYLMGWFVQAEETYKRCLELSRDDESIICTSDWYCLTLMQLGKLEEMAKVAGSITEDMDAGIGAAYHQRLLVYNGRRAPGELLSVAESGDDHLYATTVYGIAIYEHFVLGHTEEAKRILERIVQRDKSWSGFAEHAAAIELKRMEDRS